MLKAMSRAKAMKTLKKNGNANGAKANGTKANGAKANGTKANANANAKLEKVDPVNNIVGNLKNMSICKVLGEKPTTAISYEDTINAIKHECKSINLTYTKEGDGRITSAVKESEYLDLLTKNLLKNNPDFKIEQAPVRFWYDIMINKIPINLKLTTGNADDAFNKRAIIFTIFGTESPKANMNFSELTAILKGCNKKTKRDKQTEYHYLAVNKNDGKFLLKSILDIHSYKTNPSNTMQINWKNEFNNIEYETDDFKKKTLELLKTIQKSLKQSMDSMKDFVETDFEKEFD